MTHSTFLVTPPDENEEELILTNVSFYNNVATDTGDGIYHGGELIQINNSILWGSDTQVEVADGFDITINNSCIQGIEDVDTNIGDCSVETSDSPFVDA